MTLLHADFPSGSVGIYNTVVARMLDGLWAETVSLVLETDPDPNVVGGICLRVSSPAGSGVGLARMVLPAAKTTVGMASRIWLNQIPSANGRRPTPHSYRNGINQEILSIVVSPTGSIQAYAGSRNGTLLGETAGPVLTPNAWRHVESLVHFDIAVGSVEVRVEGDVVLNLTNVNTGAGPCAQMALMNQADGAGGNTQYRVKDFTLHDGDGTQNNGFIGTCGVYWNPMASDVSSGWSRTSGSSDYALVDESPPNDADYIFAGESPIPAPSIMQPGVLPPDIVSIRGIISIVRAQKSDSGDANLQISLSPNGADWDDGADRPVSTAFTYYRDVSELAPDSGTPWTPLQFPPQTKVNRTV